MTKSPYDIADTYVVAKDGTFFSLEDAYILFVHPQDAVAYDILDCGSDEEIATLAESEGEPLANLFDE